MSAGCVAVHSLIIQPVIRHSFFTRICSRAHVIRFSHCVPPPRSSSKNGCRLSISRAVSVRILAFLRNHAFHALHTLLVCSFCTFRTVLLPFVSHTLVVRLNPYKTTPWRTTGQIVEELELNPASIDSHMSSARAASGTAICMPTATTK
jgi:hypothetical protein